MVNKIESMGLWVYPQLPIIIIIFFNTLWKINRSKSKKLSEAKGKGLDRSQYYNNLDTCMHASIGVTIQVENDNSIKQESLLKT